MKKMNRILCVTLGLVVAFALVGCQSKRNGTREPVPGSVTESSIIPGTSENETTRPVETEASEWDIIPMVMVDGKLYYDTGKESTITGRCGVMDGEITSTVDGSEIPKENNQSNFGAGFEYQYGDNNTIEVFMNETWIVFEQREGSGSQVRFGDQMVDADGLSEETLEWLDWYNSLSEEDQLAVSAIPSELYKEIGFVGTEDAATSAAYIGDDVTGIKITHVLMGQLTEWNIEGDDIEALRAWSNGLECEPCEFEEGNTPGDGDGQETYWFELTGGEYPDFDYVICGPNDCYLFVENNWYIVNNPSDPPVEAP